MMFRRSIIAALAASVAAQIFSCSNLAGGGGTEWEAKTTGRAVYDGSGLPAAGALVTLCQERFLKDTSGAPQKPDEQTLRQTVTDNEGLFSIDNLKPGIYHIEVNDQQSWASLSVCEISKNDTGIAIACALKPTGWIRGTIAFPAGYRGSVYVQVYGLDRIARAAPDGAFALNDLPQGAYTLRVLPSNAEYKPKDVGTVAVAAGAGTDLGALTVPLNGSAWGYSRRMYLNTTPADADVAGTVRNFPVLVRLTDGIFPFAQARRNGEDLRFTKSDDTPLPFEIERWDSAGKAAEVWVRVDTIYGNDGVQNIIMRWGAPAALSMSNGPAVFDTADGYQGVWHLAEAGNAIAKDATGNHYDGTPSDTVPAGAEGAIGPCRSFNGKSNFIRMNGTANSKLNFKENGIYTISAWAYADTLDDGSHLIAGKSNEHYCMKLKTSFSPNPMVWEFVEYHDRAGWYITNSLPDTPSAKTWTYLVGIRKGTTQNFYLNGVLVDSAIKISSSTASRNTGDDVTIGKFLSTAADTMEGKCPFLGKIDDVRISNMAYSADWIKLSFMNQKGQDALVKW
jgi:hypothetical protein